MERDYKVLAFFFDGVPDPTKPQTPPGQRPQAAEANRFAAPGDPMASKVVRHKPFVDEDCKACHQSNDPSQIYGSQVAAGTCVTCHKDTADKPHVTHGPVVTGACGWCHDPHQSTEPALLRATATTVCMKCHESDMLSTHVAEHTRTDPTVQGHKTCTECHYGHGGPHPAMLKPAYASMFGRPQTARVTDAEPAAAAAAAAATPPPSPAPSPPQGN